MLKIKDCFPEREIHHDNLSYLIDPDREACWEPASDYLRDVPAFADGVVRWQIRQPGPANANEVAPQRHCALQKAFYTSDTLLRMAIEQLKVDIEEDVYQAFPYRFRNIWPYTTNARHLIPFAEYKEKMLLLYAVFVCMYQINIRGTDDSTDVAYDQAEIKAYRFMKELIPDLPDSITTIGCRKIVQYVIESMLSANYASYELLYDDQSTIRHNITFRSLYDVLLYRLIEMIAIGAAANDGIRQKTCRVCGKSFQAKTAKKRLCDSCSSEAMRAKRYRDNKKARKLVVEPAEPSHNETV